MGTRYSGFQVQENAMTVQSEVERALAVYLRGRVGLTGSSRTDAGVHAHQNFFHFDWEGEIPERFLYNMNAILPGDIVLKGLYPVPEDAHCRFQATGREYSYRIHRAKDPFLADRAWYFPYKIDLEAMRAAAPLDWSISRSVHSSTSAMLAHSCQDSRSAWMSCIAWASSAAAAISSGVGSARPISESRRNVATSTCSSSAPGRARESHLSAAPFRFGDPRAS